MADQAENPILAIVGLLEGVSMPLGRVIDLDRAGLPVSKSWPRLACLTKGVG